MKRQMISALIPFWMASPLAFAQTLPPGYGSRCEGSTCLLYLLGALANQAASQSGDAQPIRCEDLHIQHSNGALYLAGADDKLETWGEYSGCNQLMTNGDRRFVAVRYGQNWYTQYEPVSASQASNLGHDAYPHAHAR